MASTSAAARGLHREDTAGAWHRERGRWSSAWRDGRRSVTLASLTGL